MSARPIINTQVKLPAKVKTKKDLKPIIEIFEIKASDTLKQQFQAKRTFHEQVKFLRFLGYVE